jgi:hypothetical protein
MNGAKHLNTQQTAPKSRRRSLALAGLLLVVSAGSAIATGTGGSRTWIQDFEMSTAGWFNMTPGTIHRVPSGYWSPVFYANGVPSAHGYKHARLRTNSCEGMRTTTTCFGPFTRWGKETSANAIFPTGGYMTEVDVYLDVAWVASGGGKADYRFDWASAINEGTGNHQRDFVFNVGTPATLAEAMLMPGYYVNASTNATRSAAFPQNPCPNPSTIPNYCRTPVKITQSGWYTFRHSFYPRHHMGIDYLAVDFTVLRHDGTVMANWFISVTDTQDLIDSDRMTRIGGDRYGWFVINEIDDLAIDCSNLRPRAVGHPALRSACFPVTDHDGRNHGDDGDEDDEHDENYRKRHHDWDDD